MAAFIHRINALREARGVSYKALGEATGMPPLNLRRLNSGERTRITVDEARLLCEALGVDLRDALTDEPITLSVQVV